MKKVILEIVAKHPWLENLLTFLTEIFESNLLRAYVFWQDAKLGRFTKIGRGRDEGISFPPTDPQTCI